MPETSQMYFKNFCFAWHSQLLHFISLICNLKYESGCVVVVTSDDFCGIKSLRYAWWWVCLLLLISTGMMPTTLIRIRSSIPEMQVYACNPRSHGCDVSLRPPNMGRWVGGISSFHPVTPRY